MARFALTYAHVSSNIGDIALNAGLSELLRGISGADVVPVLAHPSPGLIGTAAETFPAIATTPHVLEPDWTSNAQLEYYCHHPEAYFEDLGIADVEGVMLHSGEHLYSPQDANALHPLALWRVLPILAAKATGRRAIVLPSTFGPFRDRDPVTKVIRAALRAADSVACREPQSRAVLDKWTKRASPTLLDPAYFLSNEGAGDLPQPARHGLRMGLTMRVEGAGLRVGARESAHRTQQWKETGYRQTQAYRYATDLLSAASESGLVEQVDIFVQGRSDRDLQEAIYTGASENLGDSVRIVEPRSLDEYRASLREVDVLVGARFHACILAMAQQVRSVGVHLPEHGHKMLGLFDQIDRGSRCASVTPDSIQAGVEKSLLAVSEPWETDQHVWESLNTLRSQTRDWLAQALSRPHSTKRQPAVRGLKALAGLTRPIDAPPLAIPQPRQAQSARVPREISTFRQRRAKQALVPFRPLSASEQKASTTVAEAYAIARDGWAYKDFGGVEISPPMDWRHLATGHRSWTYAFHSWEFMGGLLKAHNTTRDPRIIEWCVRVILDWANTYPAPDYDQEFPWYDMAIGWRVHKLAYVIDAAAQTDITDPEFRQLCGVLDSHLNAIADPRAFERRSNDVLYGLAAHASVSARLHDYPGMSDHQALASERFEGRVNDHLDDEGVHLEHSPDYHRLFVSTLATIAGDPMARSAQLVATIERSEEALAWFVQPDHTLASLGDTAKTLMETAGQRSARSPLLRAVLTDGLDGAFPAETSRCFSHAGYWIARDRWPHGPADASLSSYLAQTAGFHSRAHKQADDLSFVWWDRGAEILVDPGRFGFGERLPEGHPLWEQGFYYAHPSRLYVESTRAHNTVEIDGRSYQRRGVEPFGSAVKATGTIHDAVWSVCDVKQLGTVHHRRTLVFQPRQFVLVVDELSDNDRRHDYVQHFQFAGELALENLGDAIVVRSQGWDEPLMVVTTEGTQALTPVRGQEDPLRGWVARKDHVLEPAWSIGYKVESSEHTFIATVLAFGSEVPEVSLENTQQTWTAELKIGQERVVVTASRLDNEPTVSLARVAQQR